MKLFVIEAYGGKDSTNGHIHHFMVQADTLDDAIALIKENARPAQYARFDVVEEEREIEAEEAAILEEADGPHQRSP